MERIHSQSSSVEWVATRAVPREELRALLVKALVDRLSDLLVAPAVETVEPVGRRARKKRGGA